MSSSTNPRYFTHCQTLSTILLKAVNAHKIGNGREQTKWMRSARKESDSSGKMKPRAVTRGILQCFSFSHAYVRVTARRSLLSCDMRPKLTYSAPRANKLILRAAVNSCGRGRARGAARGGARGGARRHGFALPRCAMHSIIDSTSSPTELTCFGF